MRETIYRDDAIKALHNEWDECLVVDESGEYIADICEDVIDTIPSADKWIPCSEKLPEEKEIVAVVIKQWDTGEIKKGITYRVDRNMWVGFGRHNEACVWWLPLPPWKGADDEDN